MKIADIKPGVEYAYRRGNYGPYTRVKVLRIEKHELNRYTSGYGRKRNLVTQTTAVCEILTSDGDSETTPPRGGPYVECAWGSMQEMTRKHENLWDPRGHKILSEPGDPLIKALEGRYFCSEWTEHQSRKEAERRRDEEKRAERKELLALKREQLDPLLKEACGEESFDYLTSSGRVLIGLTSEQVTRLVERLS